MWVIIQEWLAWLVALAILIFLVFRVLIKSYRVPAGFCVVVNRLSQQPLLLAGGRVHYLFRLGQSAREIDWSVGETRFRGYYIPTNIHDIVQIAKTVEANTGIELKFALKYTIAVDDATKATQSGRNVLAVVDANLAKAADLYLKDHLKHKHVDSLDSLQNFRQQFNVYMSEWKNNSTSSLKNGGIVIKAVSVETFELTGMTKERLARDMQLSDDIVRRTKALARVLHADGSAEFDLLKRAIDACSGDVNAAVNWIRVVTVTH